jgi:hypothetical protein
MNLILRIKYNDGSTTVVTGGVDWIDRCIFNLPEEYLRQIADWSITDA